MLAILGFSTTATLFLIYVLTLGSGYSDRAKHTLQKYKFAFVLMAATFYGYAIACNIGTDRALSASVLIGNFLMLLASMLVLDILLSGKSYRRVLVVLFGFAGLVLIIVRARFFFPTPYLEDSILVFNSQRFVSFTLSAVFLGIWLPVSLHVSHLITMKAPNDLRKLAAYLYVGATLSAVIFLLAKAPITLALSFIVLSLSFLLMIILNAFLKSMKGHKHGKH